MSSTPSSVHHRIRAARPRSAAPRPAAAVPVLLGSRRVPALLATTWTAVFLAMHVAWALGWEPLFPDGTRDAAFAHPVFVAYNGLAILLCAVGTVAIAAVGDPRARRLARIGLGVLVVRGTVGLVVDLATVRSIGYDVWFLLGAALFAGALRR